MATATRITGKQTSSGNTPTTPAAPSAQRQTISERLVGWVKSHRQIASWIGAVLVVGAVLFLWTMSTKRRSEEIAGRSLAGARFAFDNQNLPLAASELAKLIAEYSGTSAAEEGRLLLANVRLMQGQPQQAVSVLKDYADGAGRAYQAQAYSLLGAAFENMGRPREAGDVYERGSAAARLDFLRAQLLADAGRAWIAAGDTARALTDYRRVVKDFSKEAAAVEARVRLAELTKGAS